MSQNIVRLLDGRHIVLSSEFKYAANDVYSESGPRFEDGSKELWDEVINNEGDVDFYTARQFIESFNKKLFQQNPDISDIRTRQELKNLGFNTIINLYESITERPMPDNSRLLDALNQAIGLTKAELSEWTKPVEDFWSEKNKPFLEKKWEEAKQNGQIAKAELSFTQTMADCFAHQQLMSAGDYMRRKAILQFISDAYSDFTGEDKVQIELIKGPPGLGGFHTMDDKTGIHVIGININNFAFQSNFQSVMNVLNHERYHASDRMLGEKYKKGEIKENDHNYKRARIAAAAFGENGYISNKMEAGQLAYREQVIEAGAHHAGKLAEYHCHDTYAKKPDPIVSVRTDTERQKIAKEYELIAKRQASVRYPQGMSPLGNGKKPGNNNNGPSGPPSGPSLRFG